MKPNSKNKKLQLKKQIISNLTKSEQANLKAGQNEQQWTTSIGHCTGFLCCTASQTCTWVTTTPSLTTTLL